MTVQRPPNQRLAAVMSEARMSNTGLANRLRKLADTDGKLVSADHVAVRRWLDGAVPRTQTCEYIASVMSRALGRSVSLTDLGFPASPVATTGLDRDGSRYPGEARHSVDLLDQLADAELGESTATGRLEWAPDATAGVITAYLFGNPADTDESPARGDAAAADGIRATAAHIMDLDFRYGGGHVSKILPFYFRSEVVPLLREALPDRRRRELFSAAAEVVQLLGWSAYDAGRHGAAQRYFVQGLRLADEAEDRLMGGRLLANLSHQANYLGHFTEAVHLARAAQAAAAGRACPPVSAMLLTMEGRALASTGESAACARALTAAENLLDRGRNGSAPAWIAYFDSGELAGEAAHCFRDLGDPVRTSEFARQAAGTDAPPRTRAFIGMVEAAGALQAGALDQAVDLAITAVNTAGPIKSRRYVRYLTDFHRTLTADQERERRIAEFITAVNRHYPAVIPAQRAAG